MNTIEQAAKRLEQLRRAGVDLGESITPSTTPDNAPPQSSSPEELTATVPVAVTVTEPEKKASSTPASDKRSREVELDFRKMHDSGLLIPGRERSSLEEEFRIIKRPLLENVKGHGAAKPVRANLIMVTSSLPGEGKTQTAINLAISMAMELDHTVLLVEADVVKPSALSRLGVPSDKGLMDLLADSELDVADVMLKTNIPKLTLLPAGTSQARSTELLGSATMDALLDELATKYSDRIVVFDSPPLLPSTEARVMSAHMGQVVMVVEAGKTPLNAIKQSFATLEEHPVVLSMLNKYQGPKGKEAYGYYAP